MTTSTEKAKILCVEDDSMLAKLCEERMRSLGYEVISESDAERAFRVFEESPEAFDLLIVGQTMPEIRGIAIAKKALAIRPDVNVVMVAGLGGTVSEDEAREAGVKDVLSEPLTMATLEAAIKRVLA